MIKDHKNDEIKIIKNDEIENYDEMMNDGNKTKLEIIENLKTSNKMVEIERYRQVVLNGNSKVL